jgi:hypothetical protein
MAFTLAQLAREQKGYARAMRVSMRPNAPCAQGLTVEHEVVAADITRVERRGYRASYAR